MPAIQIETSIPANSSVENIVVGNAFEFLPYDAQVVFAFNGDATGLAIDVHTGQDLITSQFVPLVATTMPDNQQLDFTDMVAGGERMTIRAVNSSGGAIILHTRIMITPLVG